LHRLSSSFVLGYHGCDKSDGERILRGEIFRTSSNDYDWLGTGIYFWEANPERALEFAVEKSRRAGSNIRMPFAIGVVIEMGLCLDLASKQSTTILRESYESLKQSHLEGGTALPRNGKKFWQRYLDCAVINHLHTTLAAGGSPAIDSVKGIFIEGDPIYPEAGFREKTHVQIAVRNPQCIKGVFRIPGLEK